MSSPADTVFRRFFDAFRAGLAEHTMFEVDFAARLYRAGLEVGLTGSAADLEFMCDGVGWFGERKRPYTVEL